HAVCFNPFGANLTIPTASGKHGGGR
ncbi:MAG: hypothetical protein CFH05_01293, partial [Alphaproteobacteria bacterium MarineAlpha3_Bin4]